MSSQDNIVNKVNDPEVRKAKADHLKKTFKSGLEKITNGRNNNKRKAIFLKVINTVLTGSAMIFLGLKCIGYSFWGVVQNLLPFIFISLATVINAIEPFFTYRAFWVEHEIALWHLHKLIDKFKYYISGINNDQIDLKILDEYEKEYIDIWNELSKNWIEHRKRAEY
ncbi:MAG: hypothetical protein B6I26_01450 [Desulfobacteraceae bacterium 4572_130]|nr:MAG: hypothetical protein B6I26_01450 [Desulfobacteraceae bacterium 4572_130]